MDSLPGYPVKQATDAKVIFDHINKDDRPLLFVTTADGTYPFATSWEILKQLAEKISDALRRQVDNGK
jgi:hypothetical protein